MTDKTDPRQHRGDEDAYQAAPVSAADVARNTGEALGVPAELINARVAALGMDEVPADNAANYPPGSIISFRHKDGSLLVNRVVDSVYSVLVGQRREYVNSMLETGWHVEMAGTSWVQGEHDRKPFEFTRRDGEELTLHTAVFEALGAASTAWGEPGPGHSIFDDARAKEVGNKLIDFIQESVNTEPRHLQPMFMLAAGLEDAAERVYAVNLANGWFEDDRTVGDDIALLHSEASEMLEAYRDYGLGDATEAPDEDWPAHLPKPEGFGSEAADLLIRLLDTVKRRKVNLAWEFERKLGYNATRGHKHGGKNL